MINEIFTPSKTTRQGVVNHKEETTNESCLEHKMKKQLIEKKKNGMCYQLN